PKHINTVFGCRSCEKVTKIVRIMWGLVAHSWKPAAHPSDVVDGSLRLVPVRARRIRGVPRPRQKGSSRQAQTRSAKAAWLVRRRGQVRRVDKGRSTHRRCG